MARAKEGSCQWTWLVVSLKTSSKSHRTISSMTGACATSCFTNWHSTCFETASVFLATYGQSHSFGGVSSANATWQERRRWRCGRDRMEKSHHRIGFLVSCRPLQRIAAGILHKTMHWKTLAFTRYRPRGKTHPRPDPQTGRSPPPLHPSEEAPFQPPCGAIALRACSSHGRSFSQCNLRLLACLDLTEPYGTPVALSSGVRPLRYTYESGVSTEVLPLSLGLGSTPRRASVRWLFFSPFRVGIPFRLPRFERGFPFRSIGRPFPIKSRFFVGDRGAAK